MPTTHDQASMGPRPFSRRDLQTRPPSTWARPCFNGAATFQSQRLIVLGAVAWGVLSFNGAATFQSQRRLRSWSRARIRYRLQWGRDLSVAETSIPIVDIAAMLAASMGPRPFSRRDGATNGRDGGFGGASMGPRPFSRRDQDRSRRPLPA